MRAKAGASAWVNRDGNKVDVHAKAELSLGLGRQRNAGALGGFTLQHRAAQMFFFLIIFQVPMFKMECRQGPCTTPVEVTAGQLAFSKFIPPVGIKILLWPGSLMRQVDKYVNRGQRVGMVPSWERLLDAYNLTSMPTHTPSRYIHRLDIVAGSMFAVGGAVGGIFSPAARMSLFGMLLIFWGAYKHLVYKSSTFESGLPVEMQICGWLALLFAAMTINYREEQAKMFPRRAPAGGWAKSSKDRLTKAQAETAPEAPKEKKKKR